ncbi:hypothetical protein NZK35_24720 [Stieleria sp. ICT_E10.1]|uniref:hypothetical protein n=1 Tax=Stieleria sedimenti TaxID=2976331 RepID=UPI00217F5A81|nr:hypothetical protein [Stieleria sedimenti]MCS7469868.1 hypothetical protein [Stieleria sedimenti]
MCLNRFPLVALFPLVLLASTPSAAVDATAEDWTSVAPREEIEPIFQSKPSADGDPTGLELIIRADDRQGLSGHWRRSVPVVGGRHYQFSVLRKTDGIEHPRRSAIARLLWRDKNGQKVKHAAPAIDSFRRGIRPQSEPEFPAVVVSSTYTRSTDDWIRSAIYGLDGSTLAAAEEFGTIAIAEVDLNQTHHWHSLGDFKAQLPAHRPVAVGEGVAELYGAE